MTTRQYKDAINGNIRDIIMVKLHPFMCSDHVDRCIGYPDHKVEVDEAVGRIEALFSESEPKSSPNTTPLNEELEKILKEYAEGIDYHGSDGGDRPKAKQELTNLIQTLEKKARIDELDGWFDLPKHYPGEEYRDEPFAKVKCKLPSKIQYYTLDSGFTYALKVRLNELSAGATAESPNNTTTRSKE